MRTARTTAPTDALSWAEAQATIVHPSRGRCAFDPYPYQRAFLSAYDARRRIVVKARQVGFSQVFAIEALYAAITEPHTTVLLVSRSQDLAINLLRYCYQTYNGLRQAPALVKENESEIGLSNGSRIKSIPANRSTGRGFTAGRVYLDEFAYAAYAEEIYQSVSPAIATGGTLTIGSTPNGANNLFHSLYAAGEGFERYSVPWHDCPVFWTAEERAAGVPKEQAAWYLREREQFSAQAWAAEYDCDFAASGVTLFSADDLARAEEGALGETPAQPGRWYITSVDVGRRRDATVINTFDASQEPYQRVAHDRLERVPYPVIQRSIEARYREYGGGLVIESNGVGDPLIENLNVPAEPFVTTARSKVQALESLQLLLEQGRVKARWTAEERRELLAYTWQDQNISQDCVMSLALGASVLTAGGTPGV